MPFFVTRPNFEDRQVVQYSGDTITLSGDTNINNLGYIQINAPILDFTGTTTASTIYNIAGVQGYVNYGQPSSFIIQPPIIYQSGSTGTTTVDVTGYILGGMDSSGRVTWYPSSYFLTGSTGSGTTYVIVQFTGNTSASCVTDLYVTNIHGCSPVHIQPIGNDTYIGEGGGRVAIGSPTFVPQTILHLYGDISGVTDTFRITNSSGLTHLNVTNSGEFTWENMSSLVIKTGVTLTIETGSVAGYVLTSDSLGNATWQPSPSGSSGGTTSPYIFGPNNYDIVTLSGNNFTLSNQSLVLGGYSNISDGIGATIINGQFNILTGGTGTTIINGSSHVITNSDGSMIGNGFLNTITSSKYSSIINGNDNLINSPLFSSEYSFIGGGNTNSILSSKHSFIGNGAGNNITVFGGFGGYNTILNGQNDSISTSVNYSTIINGLNNAINFSYSTIIGGQNNTINHTNSSIIGSNITTSASNTTYVEKFVAGASSVNTYVGHLNVNDYNTYGPIRPNYITELLTSGNTTGGTYSINISSGWTVTDVQVYVKTNDPLVVGATIGTVGGVWCPICLTSFIPTHNITTLFRSVPENGPHYFENPDSLIVYFVDLGATPQTLTTGEYKVLITYWDNLELVL